MSRMAVAVCENFEDFFQLARYAPRTRSYLLEVWEALRVEETQRIALNLKVAICILLLHQVYE